MGEELTAHHMAVDLARSLLARGDVEEADQLASRVARLAAPSYRSPQVGWRGIKALVLANRGATTKAVELAREGVALADGSDWLELQGKARLDLAEALVAAGNDQEADAVLEEAIERFKRKEDVISARRARERLAELSELPPART
jgi:tetratricopeptide (TPR) repeat protein